MQDFLFSADDGGVLGAQADGKGIKWLRPSAKTL
jgi:hypothetical protein